eukprot:1187308-Prorocentrum_minimum.AAC.2
MVVCVGGWSQARRIGSTLLDGDKLDTMLDKKGKPRCDTRHLPASRNRMHAMRSVFGRIDKRPLLLLFRSGGRRCPRHITS